MRKIVLFLIITFSSFNCFSQQKENSEIFNSEKYQTLKKYYFESIDSGKMQEFEAIKKEIITKVGKDNFMKLKDNKDVDSWLKDNWSSTSFASLEESESYFKKLQSIDSEIKELTKHMTPLFSELRKEVGYSALFKKLSEDYNKSVLN